MFALETEEDWLKLRKQVITATEAAVILGQNKYLSPAKMLEEKLHKTFVGNSYTNIGQLLETVVIAVVNKTLKKKFVLLEQDGLKVFYKHAEIKLGATPDAAEDRTFLECKTTKPLNYLRYKYNPPGNYLMQLQTQLYCADYELGYLAIMSTDLSPEGPDSPIPITIFEVHRNSRLCDILRSEVNRFWDCIDNKKLFRVSSVVKKEVKILLDFCYRKVV